MNFHILGIKDQMLVRSIDDLRYKHWINIEGKRSLGAEINIYDSDETLIAHVDAGKWKAKCKCGDEPALQPGWDVAMCFNCGARFTNIKWPEDMELGIATLLKRDWTANRFWFPWLENANDLVLENKANGIKS